jgi:hypothetical protein
VTERGVTASQLERAREQGRLQQLLAGSQETREDLRLSAEPGKSAEMLLQLDDLERQHRAGGAAGGS